MTLYDKQELPEGVNIPKSEDAFFVYKNYSREKVAQRDEIRKRIKMPEWPVAEDLVVSGISGRFPESDNVEEFAHNLYSNIDMVVEDEKRWPFGYLGLPRGSGKIKDISLFDHEFFNVSEEDANLMDSQIRIMLEITFEALWDAGIDPNTWAGSNTGVFLGHCFDEYLAAYAEEGTNIPDYRQSFFAMLHNVYDFRGPAKHFDSACASGFSAMHEAVVSLRAGECDRAIVVGLNICLRAGTQNQFLNLNMLSPDGHCKCLDHDANGYAKGEACVAVVLQRKSEAKRVYTTIIHTKTNCDGYKDFGITYPSFELQCEVISDAYKEANVDPLEVEYCEAHCTGTQAGDPSEMRSIVESMCIGRTKPLLIGALKSVIGHTEASSGLCSLVKTILSFENEMIPANLNMNKINRRIEGLVSGILRPITVNTPFKGRLIALNCFGFGGVNVHAIIQKNLKEISANDFVFGMLPRLVTFCGRNQETLNKIYQFLINNPEKITIGFLALLDEISKTSPYPNKMFKGMSYRGSLLFTPDENHHLKPSSEFKLNEIKDKEKPPICFVFTGMGCQWPAMGRELIQINSMANIFQKCSEALKNMDSNIDLIHLLTSDNPKLFQSVANSFISIAAIQMAITEFLKELEIEPDFIVGHSIGELSCAYVDNCLTLEEAICSAYLRGKCVEEVLANKPGKMAAIGCTWQQAMESCEKYSNGNVWPACHNSFDSVTVSGSQQDVDCFLKNIQKNEPELFVRAINSSNKAFHCPFIQDLEKPLLERLVKLIKSRNTISSKWLSTTYDKKPHKFTAEYLVDNLIKPVKFHEVFQCLPPNAIFVEIAPHNLLQAIIKRNIFERNSDSMKYVSTLSRNSSRDNIVVLLKNIGSLYLLGLNPKIEKLYPKVEYPIARTTHPFHSMISWKHDRKFKCTQYPEFFNHAQKHQTIKTIDLQHQDEKFYTDHCIDGRILFPATGYLYLAWEIVAKILNVNREELPIIFEDVNLHRATIMSKSGITDFSMKLNKENGTFAILQGSTVTTTGKIKIPDKRSKFLLHQHMLDSVDELRKHECLIEMKTKDIYKEFRLRGYDYGPEFQTIEQLNVYNKSALAKVVFKNWVTFVDGMIQTAVLGKPVRGLFVPVRLNYLHCDPKILAESLKNSDSITTFDTLFDGILNIGVARGIEFQGIKANLAPRKIHTILPTESTYEFVSHTEQDMLLATSRCNSFERRIYLTEQLIKYQELCARFIENKTFDETFFNLEEYETKVADPILMKILKQIDFENFEQSSQIEKIEDDLLFTTYLNEVFLRPQLETVNESILESLVEILEVGQTRSIISRRILKWISMDTFKMNFNCRLLHSSLSSLNQDQLSSFYSQHEWLVEKSKFPTDLTNLDLVIFKDSSLFPLMAKHEINFELMLESLWNCIRDNRFALILIRNVIFPIERHLMKRLNIPLPNSESRLTELMNALNKSSFRIIGHKNDKLGVHSIFIRKIIMEIIPENQYFINITHNVKEWFEELQNRLKEVSENQNGVQKFVWLIANEYNSGVIGLVNCLRKEPIGTNVRCLINNQINFPVDVGADSIRNIIKLNLYLNALGPDGSFGAYRHFSLPLKDNELVPVEHCYLNTVTRGDLSSLRWFESQHKYWPICRKPDQTLSTVYYAALNFRDIMLATGKLPPDALPDDIGLDDCLLGFEFSGRDENGNRVMGMLQSRGLATSIVMESTTNQFLWPIPAHWTMEEAATVPVAYATAYYALVIRGKLKPKEKVLIHSGSGGVGQAAISICLSYNCHLFVTVGSEEKRNFLMQKFPDLKPNQFASSRNTDFEKIILHATNGRGVDIILNSLAEEKLRASVNCLASYGRFLEIGKFDLSQDNKLSLSQIMKNKTFHGILLDNLIHLGPNTSKKIITHRNKIRDLIDEGIQKGVVRPLNRTIFPVDKCEEAFRFMASGKHTGKVVICIREEEKEGPNFEQKLTFNNNLKIPALQRTVFYMNKSYIITGGLGGFGLELLNWMVERDARNFVLTSRSGIKDLYQKTRLKYFSDLGIAIKIFMENTLVEEGVGKLIDEALELGPLGGVFHLAMVLNDGLFDNQTLESFENVVEPKANTFLLLDKITRERSLNLDYFVAFSSVSCGVGNPGQTNYGYANSVMERICDQRRRDGLHGFAIQWGPIGDVGYIIDNIRGNDIVVCGTAPQRIPSCLNILDKFLQSPYSVGSSLIWLDLKFEVSCGKPSLIKTVAHILGVKDYENLQANVTLGELGMDSLMAVEVKQAVERDYDIILSMQDLRKLTIKRIIEISKGKSKSETQCSTENIYAKISESIDEKLVPIEPIIYLNDIINGDPIIFLPQLDATYDKMIPIAKKLNRPVIGINWTKECRNFQTIPETASYYIKMLENHLPNLNNYDVIAYSFGGIIAIEIGLQLQQRKVGRLRRFKKLILLDSSPKQFKIYTEEAAKKFSIENKKFDDLAYVESILMFLMAKMTIDYGKIKEILLKMENKKQRIEFVGDLFRQSQNIDIKNETLEFLMQTHYNKMLMTNQYQCPSKQFIGDITLIRASDVLMKREHSLRDDYLLEDLITDGRCNVHILKGDHETFITDNYDELIRLIRNYI